MIDYVLTVAVSISAGILALTSTDYIPKEYTTTFCNLATLLIMVVNLRGVRESGLAFAFPAYTFLGAMGALIVTGNL